MGLEWTRRSDNSLLTTTSSLSPETETSLSLEWRETGLRAEASSTMLPRLSLSGSMKKISSESFPCRRVGMSRVSLRDSPEASRLLVTLSKGVWKGLLSRLQIRLHPLLPNQSWYWHESFRACCPPRMDQVQCGEAQGKI